MEKKIYQAPEVKKVRLDVKGAVLAVCHASTVIDSNTPPLGCGINTCSMTP